LIVIKGKGERKIESINRSKRGEGEKRSRHKEPGEKSCPNLGGKNTAQRVLPKNCGGRNDRHCHNLGKEDRELGP
jgi:hypothetical protein